MVRQPLLQTSRYRIDKSVIRVTQIWPCPRRCHCYHEDFSACHDSTANARAVLDHEEVINIFASPDRCSPKAMILHIIYNDESRLKVCLKKFEWSNFPFRHKGGATKTPRANPRSRHADSQFQDLMRVYFIVWINSRSSSLQRQEQLRVQLTSVGSDRR